MLAGMRTGALLGLLLGLLLVGCGSGPSVPQTGTRAGLELVGEPAILTKEYGLREAVGRVRNTDTEARSGNVEVTLFGADGKVVGTAVGLVSGVQPGGDATYNGAVGTTVPEVARVEARVGAQYRTKR